MSNKTGFGWENFNSHLLKHGMILMIDEVNIAYVVENTFSGKNGNILRKITGVSDTGWMNEL